MDGGWPMVVDDSQWWFDVCTDEPVAGCIVLWWAPLGLKQVSIAAQISRGVRVRVQGQVSRTGSRSVPDTTIITIPSLILRPQSQPVLRWHASGLASRNDNGDETVPCEEEQYCRRWGIEVTVNNSIMQACVALTNAHRAYSTFELPWLASSP